MQKLYYILITYSFLSASLVLPSILLSQAIIKIENTGSIDSMVVYGADEYRINYYKDSVKIVTDKLVEPQYLQLLLFKKDNVKQIQGVWIENEAVRKIKIVNNVFSSNDNFWIEKKDILANKKDGPLFDSLKQEYFKTNNDFLSIFYLSHIMYRLNLNEICQVKETLLEREKLYKQYPNKYQEVLSYINLRCSNPRRCVNTNDSIISFEYYDSDSIVINPIHSSMKQYQCIYFTFLGCKPCVPSTKHLDSLYKKSTNSAVNLAMFVLASPKITLSMLKEYYNKFSIPWGTDFKGDTSPILYGYGVQSYPTLLIFKDGKLYKKFEDAQMIKTIKDLNNP